MKKFMLSMAVMAYALCSCNPTNNADRDESEDSGSTTDDPGTTVSGLKAVDLGLSVRWADANLGANAPEDYGDYFKWDEAQSAPSEGWRVPTKSEIKELVSTMTKANYSWEWTSRNGHNGWLIVYLEKENSIFLPAAGWVDYTELDEDGYLGYYWSSSPYEEDPDGAWYLYIDEEYVACDAELSTMGFTVRAVTK